MKPSKSSMIELESISLAELAERPAGSYGLYIQAKREDMEPSLVRQRLSTTAKSVFSRTGRTCKVSKVLLNHIPDGNEEPSAFFMTKIEVIK